MVNRNHPEIRSDMMDLILTNANIITMDDRQSRVAAVAVKWDRIFQAGKAEDIQQLAAAETQIIDLAGKTVLPGFIDTHNHLSFYGYLVSSADCRASSGVESIDDILERLRTEADKTPAGEWVKGWGYAHYQLKENQHLTRDDLDRASTEHPILVIQVSGHAGVANSRALEAFGYTKETPDPPGGAIRRDPTTGEPNGILDETAVTNQVNMLFMQEAMSWSAERRMQMIETAQGHYNEAGITSLHEAYVAPQTLQIYQEMDRLGRLNLRIYTMNIDIGADTLLNAGMVFGYGTPMLKIGPVKMFLDGGMSNRTAAVMQPYEDSDERGIYMNPPEVIRERIEKFHNAGYQIAVHTQGDEAIGHLLDAYENVLGTKSDNPLRHRIEHCGNITEEQIKRAADMNIFVSSQPIFFSHVGDGFLQAFGPERGHRLYPYRSLINHGIRVGGASDCPVAPAEPLVGIRDAILRKTGSGADFGPEERLGITEAIGLYTSEAAWFSFDENKLGTIESGKYADFVVLDRDITSIPPEEIGDVDVEMTIVGGRIVYRK
jgi:predicted amidohydrolase YtcJ